VQVLQEGKKNRESDLTLSIRELALISPSSAQQLLSALLKKQHFLRNPRIVEALSLILDVVPAFSSTFVQIFLKEVRTHSALVQLWKENKKITRLISAIVETSPEFEQSFFELFLGEKEEVDFYLEFMQLGPRFSKRIFLSLFQSMQQDPKAMHELLFGILHR